jgi:superoxide dismutase, Cu-Zn family
MKIKKLIAAIAVIWPFIMTLFVPAVSADTLNVRIFPTQTGQANESIGTVKAMETPYGLLLTPDLKGLPPGVLGFHVHQNPNCSAAEKDGKTVAGLAAGSHYDPTQTGVHLGPYSADGHLGDLPPLYVGTDGTATVPVLAPRLKVTDLAKRSLMIHEGGDNFADTPNPLGGGGARLACGMIDAA